MRAVMDQFFRITDGIAMSDVIGWVFAAVGAYIIYCVIDNLQTSMERHNMLREVEDRFSGIYNSVVAKSGEAASVAEIPDVMVRSVLHDFTPWEVHRENKDGQMRFANRCEIVNNQRYLQIRSTDRYNEWISTQALHEVTLYCRRIEKMFKAGIIRQIDLADMFREIVPLGMSGRVEFFAGYYGKYDADCIGYLVMQTVVACERYHNPATVEKFMEYYNAHPDIHGHFENSIRIRRIKDRYSVYKFKSLSKKYS